MHTAFFNYCGSFDPVSPFPVAHRLRNLPDIYLGIEVGGKNVAMRSGVAVKDVEVVYLVEKVLLGVSCEDIRHSGIEAGPEKGHDPFLPEPLLVCPLPAIFEMGLIGGLIVGGVYVVHARLETGIHDMQVLIRQRQVKDHVGPEGLHEGDEFRDIVRIHPGRSDIPGISLPDVIPYGITFGEGPAGYENLFKNAGNCGA
jgi:hypothetical protein